MSRRLTAGVVSTCCLLGLGLAACQDEGPTTPALSVSCQASPASGPAPLDVRFLLSIAGAEGPAAVAVSYGDGATASDPDLPHTYAAAGTYTASFEVATATQSARCSAIVSVGPGSEPSPSPNQPPVGVFRSTPRDAYGTISGTAPLSVRFNMCASTDPEGDTLVYLMDFNDDGLWESAGRTGAHCRHDNVFAAGTHRVKTCVYDESPSREVLHNAVCKRFSVVATP